MTKEERYRKRLVDLIEAAPLKWSEERSRNLADAILREFALRPVSQGKVDSETGEVGAG